MSSSAKLPRYETADLEQLDVDGLVALMLRDEDRVPRAVIDACAARGDETVAWLRRLVAREYWRVDLPLNEWWLKLHAAMILGLIGTDAAGLLLVDLMRRMSEEGDENLQDWFAGEWPALFQNKPESSASALRALSEDRSLDWYIRADALDAVIAAAARAGEGSLARSLDWAAALAADDREDWDMRVSIGATLLDFPRTAHRPMLEDLAARQLRDGEWGVHFAPDEVREAFDTGRDAPGWDRRPKPWNFYAPEHILQRQERWAAEAAAAARAERAAQSAAPYVRTNPRIGRNDPCPCGSGKKYKKCCMPATEV